MAKDETVQTTCPDCDSPAVKRKGIEPYRLTARLFGAFCRFLLDGRQPICVEERPKVLGKSLLAGA